MVKSYRSKKHNKKHRGGEGEVAEDNSVLNMDDKPPTPASSPEPESAPAPTPASSPEPESAAAPASATTPASTPAPVEEEKKGWFKSLFGGSKKKHVRFRTTKKHKHGGSKHGGSRKTKKAKHGGSRKTKRSGHKRSGHKRSGRKA